MNEKMASKMLLPPPHNDLLVGLNFYPKWSCCYTCSIANWLDSAFDCYFRPMKQHQEVFLPPSIYPIINQKTNERKDQSILFVLILCHSLNIVWLKEMRFWKAKKDPKMVQRWSYTHIKCPYNDNLSLNNQMPSGAFWKCSNFFDFSILQNCTSQTGLQNSKFDTKNASNSTYIMKMVILGLIWNIFFNRTIILGWR